MRGRRTDCFRGMQQGGNDRPDYSGPLHLSSSPGEALAELHSLERKHSQLT
jgi:hypothetical protein